MFLRILCKVSCYDDCTAKEDVKNAPCFETRHCMLKIYFVSFKGWRRTLGSENTDIV